ncbi:MAG: uracil-xanthine permease, partial [Burkholderiales bacterium]|nr:uracil-xanthine permease [Burkholderiales bacterium]
FILAGALVMGLLPILVPGVYNRFPSSLQLVLGNGLAMGSLTAVALNLVFNHLGARKVQAPAPAGTAPAAH